MNFEPGSKKWKEDEVSREIMVAATKGMRDSMIVDELTVRLIEEDGSTV